MRSRVLGGALAVATAAALAAGCSNGAAPPATGTSAPAPSTSLGPTPAVAAEHDAADVAFVQGMIPHHSQAIAMSRQAATRASSPQVKDLASRIAAAQDPEIQQMEGMLAAWGLPPATGMPGRPGTGPMPGMMSDQQMGALAGMSGPAFDPTFLQMMTAHHQGAVDMAATELAQGQNPQAEQLARSIIAAQRAEIGEMQTLLRQG